MCVRSFHDRIPPGLEAAGGLNRGKGGGGRRERPSNMGAGLRNGSGKREYGRRKRECVRGKIKWEEEEEYSSGRREYGRRRKRE